MSRVLWLEGRQTAIAVDLRCRFLGRLRGLLGQRRPAADTPAADTPAADTPAADTPAADTCVWLERCAAVHTIGMRFALDLAFVSRDGVVLRVDTNVPPGRIRWMRGANAVVEASAGVLSRSGVKAGSRLAARPRAGAPCSVRRRQAGSATIEFVAAATLVLLPLVGAIFEGVQLAMTRQLLTVAAVEAARIGAVTHGDLRTMRRRLARGLVPLFGAPVPGTDDAAALRAYASALLEVDRPDLTRFRIDRPTAAAFVDFAVDAGGHRQIPNDGDALLPDRGAASGLTLAQSNVLAIRVRYCRRLVVPVLDEIITVALRNSGFSADPFDLFCLARGRVPIEVRASLHMQSPARAAALGIGR